MIRFNRLAKRIIKLIAAVILYYSGIVRLHERLFLRDTCIVLTYHQVVSTDSNQDVPQLDGMVVGRDAFERHLQYLSRNYSIVTLPEFIETMKKGKGYKRTCLITFDDGWKDNYDNAFPILKKYGVSGTIFLATDYIGTNDWFWHDKAAYLLKLTTPGDQESVGWPETRKLIATYHQDSLSPDLKMSNAIEILKGMRVATRRDVVCDLERLAHCNAYPTSRRMLDWSEVLEMKQEKIYFGSHTRGHEILTQLESGDVAEQLRSSKIVMEEKLGAPVTAFCYPNGEYTDKIAAQVKAAEYDCAFTTMRGTVSRGDDAYALKRITIHHDIAYNTPMLACRINFGIF